MDDVNVFRSTFSERIFASLHNINNENNKSKWIVVLTTLLSNILLPGLILSYGLIGYIRKENGHPMSEILITPCIFCVTWTLADPWLYDAVDNRCLLSKYLSFIGVTICFMGIVSNAWLDNIFYHGVFFGILGGLGTSLVFVHLNYIMEDVCQSSVNKIRLLSFYGQAIGACMLPYVYMILFHFYGHLSGYLLIGGLILQILPLTILLRNMHHKNNRKNKPLSLTYKRAYSLFDDETSTSSNINEVPLADLSKKSWRSPSDENLHKMISNEGRFLDDEYHLPEFCYEYEEEKCKTYHGVEILPQILEENEDSDDEDVTDDNKLKIESCNKDAKLLEKNIKRLSAISNKLDDIIAIDDNTTINYINAESSKNVISYEKSKASDTKKDENSNITKRNRTAFEGKTCSLFSKLRCSSYRCFRLNKFLKNIPEYVSETLIYPLTVSLKTWKFYPVLLLRTSTLCLLFCFSSFVALLGFTVESKLSLSSITFILSIHGISWLSFLILSPWITNLKKSNFKFVTSFGSLVASIGLFVIFEFTKLELIILGTALSGIGCCALSISYQDTSRDFIGLRKWSKLKGTLETLSAILVLGIGTWMSNLLTSKNGVVHCFQLLSSLLFICSLFWIIIIFIESIRQQDHDDHNVFWPHLN